MRWRLRRRKSQHAITVITLGQHLRRLLPRDASTRVAAGDLTDNAAAFAVREGRALAAEAAGFLLLGAETTSGVSFVLLTPRCGGLIRPEDDGRSVFNEVTANCGAGCAKRCKTVPLSSRGV